MTLYYGTNNKDNLIQILSHIVVIKPWSGYKKNTFPVRRSLFTVCVLLKYMRCMERVHHLFEVAIFTVINRHSKL